MPVSKSIWLDLMSIFLGILGFLTSFLFIWSVLNWLIASIGRTNFEHYPFLQWLYFGGGMFILIPLSLILGLVSLILGLLSARRSKSKGWASRAGILLGTLAILAGIPSLIVILTVLRAMQSGT